MASPLVSLFFFLSWLTICVSLNFDDAVIADLVSNLGIRGAAIVVYNKNTMEIPIAKGYGRVSSDPNAAVVTPNTAFMIASLSKPFVAAAVAVLVDRGIISLDDDICNVIPDDFSTQMCRNPQFPNQPVTWRMLVTHRSSLKRELPMAQNQFGDWISPSSGPSGSAYADFHDTGNPTCPLNNVIDFYRVLLTDDPNAKTTVGAGVKLQNGDDLNWHELALSEGGIWGDYMPGERVEYSNVAYGYLPALIELATGQSFAEFCRENLFAPLGMDTTAWFLDDLPIGTESAVPVEKSHNGGFQDIGHYCFIDYGSGALRTTANDLVRWGNAMLEYGTSTLWSSAVGNQISTCQERDETNEPISTDCEFGYGWVLENAWRRRRLRRNLEQRDDDDDDFATFVPSTETSDESTIESETTIAYDLTGGISHSGSEAGVQTNMVILPNAGIFVAVLLNTNDDDYAAEDLTAALLNAVSPNGSLDDLFGSSSRSLQPQFLWDTAITILFGLWFKLL